MLRGDIVKDDWGSYAVFTEQGSSASQMTAAKIMDIISWLPGCDGQAADAVSAKTQVKMEGAYKLLKIPKSECPDTWIRLPRQKMAKIMVQYWRPGRSSWKEFVRSSFGRTIMGKAIWENPIETWLGENSKLGMSLCSSWKRIVLICVCGWHKIGLKNKILIWCGKYSTKKSIWENQQFVCVTNGSRKSNGCHCKATWWCRKSGRRSIRLRPSEDEGRSKIAQDSEVRVSRCMDTSSTTEMTGIVVKHWRRRGSSRTKFVRTPTCRPQFEEVLPGLGWEKVPNWECLFVHRKQGLFLSVSVDDIAEYGSPLEEMDETCRSWRTNIISWPRLFGMHSKWMQTERKNHWGIQKCSNHESLLEQLKNCQREKPHAKTGRLVLRRKRSFAKVRGKV